MKVIRNDREYSMEEKQKYIDEMKELYKSMLEKASGRIDWLFDTLDKDLLFNAGIAEIAEVCNEFISDFMNEYIEDLRAQIKSEQVEKLTVISGDKFTPYKGIVQIEKK